MNNKISLINVLYSSEECIYCSFIFIILPSLKKNKNILFKKKEI
jgi:hypothetical protein